MKGHLKVDLEFRVFDVFAAVQGRPPVIHDTFLLAPVCNITEMVDFSLYNLLCGQRIGSPYVIVFDLVSIPNLDIDSVIRGDIILNRA